MTANGSVILWSLALTLFLSSPKFWSLACAADDGSWASLPPLPNELGVAGAICGTDGQSLIVAGGANFPLAPPWENGNKVWYDQIYVLESPEAAWKLAGKLPHPVGYAVSLSIPSGPQRAAGVACLGGSDASRHYAECYMLNLSNGQVQVEPLPPLPKTCANACGVVLGDTIYVAGGTESPTATHALHSFWSLNLNSQPLRWIELEPWPGPARMLAVAAVQDKSLYLCSGADLSAATDGRSERRYLKDCYRFRPREGWKRMADMPHATVAAPYPAPATGQSSFLVIGGDDGSRAEFQPMSEHPGFPRKILAYHTITDTWKTVLNLPVNQVSTSAVSWQGRWVLPSGEIKPGVRSPAVWSLIVSPHKKTFGWANTSVVIAYLLLMVWIGWICSKKNQTTNDYFRGGQRIPWWAAGLSIFATMLSSITYMSIPAAGYTDGWGLFLGNTYIIIMPLIVFVFLPFYRRLDVTSAYEYLEKRFNLTIRMLGSLLFMLFQCGRIAVVLYLPSLALSTVSDIDIETCIVGIGLLCIAYTVIGGMEAVIWTDVTQAIVLILGAIISLVYLLWQVEGGIAETVRIASEGGKLFESVIWSWDLTVASAWVIMIGAVFHYLSPYGASQDVVQRYLTTHDEKTAAKGIWLNAILSVPAQAAFFAIGTGLYAFYRQHPEKMDICLQNDGVFPFFIVTELPIGLAGLIVSGIFSASQSTISSSINSIATAYVTDFYLRLRPGKSDSDCMSMARWVTVVIGLLGIAIALTIAKTDIRSAYSTFIEMLGILGGILSGLFILGMFTRRANGSGALAGAMAAAVVVFAIRWNQPLQVFAYAPIGLMTCVTIGWAFSHLSAGNYKELNGLTLYD